jgi:hypothetical protein
MPQLTAIFRVLRPDEQGELRPRSGPLPSGSRLSEAVQDHIKNDPGHPSCFLSFTSELNVALAFGGCVSRVAVVDTSNVTGRFIPLDGDYLCSHVLSDREAARRSRRADEVLFFGVAPQDLHFVL